MPQKTSDGINEKMRAAHVGLRTPDYEGTIRWYTEKLGFRLLQQWTVGDLQLAFLAPANDDAFWLEVLSGGIPNTQPAPSHLISSGFQHLCLEVDNVEETLAVLRTRGVEVVRESFNVPAIGKRCGFIADLYGNVIELVSTIEAN
ncbi:hypothetical protein BXP70_15760 [Hymenobacter crusticola]|uniref:VOC domain-containing protein n=2 Tax=Hymenobacter crusticola TaxID=1770526 RepID=A0A243WD03_9BACT|nr:hypothetical protein BXP70_15760 [Hymenobacter crusticola]